MNLRDRFKAKFDGIRGKEPPKLVADLDAIVQETVSVRLHGRTHTIRPIEVAEFFQLSNALARIRGIEAADKVTFDQILDAYHGLISSVAPTVTKDDLRKCSHAQIAAFLQVVIDHVTGGLTDEKKKALKAQMLPAALQ
jgi:hypothetical protein